MVFIRLYVASVPVDHRFPINFNLQSVSGEDISQKLWLGRRTRLVGEGYSADLTSSPYFGMTWNYIMTPTGHIPRSLPWLHQECRPTQSPLDVWRTELLL